MMLAAGLGVAGYAFAIFHLLMHGFFKADMFLGAGSVMHGMDDDVDMRHYGALQKAMPVTFLTFSMGFLAIIGFPGFSGFWSKDHIIEAAFGNNLIVGLCATLGAGITAFYMSRLMLMTFLGKKRWSEGVHPHESPKVMTVPLIVLAALSVFGGVLLIGDWIVDWLSPVVGTPPAETLAISPIALSAIVVVVVAVGVAIAWFTVGTHDVPRVAPANVSVFTKAARADLYGDAFNEAAFMRPGDRFVNDLATIDRAGIDGVVNGTGLAFGGLSGRMRRLQTGFVRSYALSVLGGAVIVVLALLAVNLA
jgi:NADH-quinone oxidoreductase subunit L